MRPRDFIFRLGSTAVVWALLGLSAVYWGLLLTEPRAPILPQAAPAVPQGVPAAAPGPSAHW